jgi:hypothetical protein
MNHQPFLMNNQSSQWIINDSHEIINEWWNISMQWWRIEMNNDVNSNESWFNSNGFKVIKKDIDESSTISMKWWLNSMNNDEYRWNDDWI